MSRESGTTSSLTLILHIWLIHLRLQSPFRQSHSVMSSTLEYFWLVKTIRSFLFPPRHALFLRRSSLSLWLCGCCVRVCACACVLPKPNDRPYSYKVLFLLVLSYHSTLLTAVGIWNLLSNTLALLPSFCPLHILPPTTNFFYILSKSLSFCWGNTDQIQSSWAVLEILAKLTPILPLITSLQV